MLICVHVSILALYCFRRGLEMQESKNVRRNWLWRISCCSSVIALSAPHIAMGQATPVPPVHAPLDENNVDVATGKPFVTTPSLSIGAANGSKLEFNQVWVEGFWTHPYLISVSIGGTISRVVTGASGDLFNFVSGTWVATNGNGATLVPVPGVYPYAGYTYTTSDGVKVNFSNSSLLHPGGYSTYGGRAITHLATSVDLPSGERILFTYKQAVASDTGTSYARLQSINSSSGWQIKLAYASNTMTTSASEPAWNQITSAQGINNAVEYCDPTADACSLTQPWPVLNFAQALVSGITTLTVTDPLSRASKFRINASSQLVGVRRPSSPASDDVTYGYDANGFVSSVTRDAIPYSYTFSLSGSTLTGTVSGPNRAGGASGKIRITKADTSKGLVTQSQEFTSQALGDSSSATTNYQYDTRGRLIYFIPPEGTVSLPNPPTAGYTKYTYDARDNVIEERRVSKIPGAPADIVITAGYDATCTNVLKCNQPNWVKDARGNQTDYVYDAATGFVTSVKLPADPAGVRPETRYTYTALRAYTRGASGALLAAPTTVSSLTQISSCTAGATCAGTANERLTLYNYGAVDGTVANNLLPVVVTRRDGGSAVTAQSSLAYDKVGNLTSVDGPLAGAVDTTTYRYDAARQRIGVVAPDPDGAGSRLPLARRTAYNADGQVTLVETGNVANATDASWVAFAPTRWVQSVYDSNSRLTQTLVQAPNGSGGSLTFALTQNSYDAMGRLDCTAVRMDPTQWGGQTNACVPQTTGANGSDRITRRGYDAASRVVTVTEGVGTAAPRVTQTNAYTSNGLTQSVTDAKGNKTTYEYDGFDRLLKTRYPSATANTSSTIDFELLAYDADSHVTQRTLRPDSTSRWIDFTYDAIGRLRTMQPNAESLVTVTQNLVGETTRLARADGVNQTLTYDGLGRVLSETQPFGSASYLYNAAGMRTRITWNDGFYVVYDYDNVGNVTAIRENNAASGVGVLGSYTYDANTGARKTVTYGNGTVRNYEYNLFGNATGIGIDLAGTANDSVLGQIGPVGSKIAYNPAGQLTSITRSNDLYAWTGAINAERNYTPDFLNRYASVATVTPAQTTTLGYDSRGNLTTSTTGTTVSNYTYNRLNQMISGPNGTSMGYDVSGRLAEYNTSVSTRFVYDGSAMIAEVSNPAAAILRRYVHGPGTDEPIVWYEGSGTTDRRFLQADERGSIVAISDSTGAKLGINSYDEYGIPAATNIGRFGYTGQTWFPEVGLANYKARWYSPTLGRFMQTDPIAYGDGLNWYNYVGGDPVNRSDPSGMKEDPPGTTVTGQSYDPYIFQRIDPEILRTAYALTNFPPFAANGYNTVAPAQDQIVVRGKRQSKRGCTTVDSGSTIQIGFAGQGTYGIFSFQSSFGVAFDSHGNVALYGTFGPGGGVGGGGTAGLSVQGSNAPTVQDLGGFFSNGSVGGGAGGGGTVDVFGGYARNGQPIVGGGGTAGVAGGETSFAGVTDTFVSPSLNLLGRPTC